MIDHERALELAAAAFDFQLSPADDEALTAHLESCESCRATVQAMRADQVALVGLQREDAPEDLRQRILDAASAGSERSRTTSPAPAVSAPKRPILLHFPARLRHPAVLVAAAAVIVAVVGGTLAWRAVPGPGNIAVTNPSNRPNGSAEPGTSGGPGDPGPTNPPGPANPDLVTAYAPVAELTAQKASGGVVDLDSGFVLTGLAGTPASELADPT